MAKKSEVLDFLNTRRSRSMISMAAPGPNKTELTEMLKIASRVPDHGRLVPWRFVVVGQNRLAELAELAAKRCTELGKDDTDIQKAQRQFIKSPGMVAVIASPKTKSTIPPQEQVLTAGAVCLSLVNAALASGWAPVWLSGWISHDRAFAQEAFDLGDDEWIAGFVHIGTETDQPSDRPRPDLECITQWLD